MTCKQSAVDRAFIAQNQTTYLKTVFIAQFALNEYNFDVDLTCQVHIRPHPYQTLS